MPQLEQVVNSCQPAAEWQSVGLPALCEPAADSLSALQKALPWLVYTLLYPVFAYQSRAESPMSRKLLILLSLSLPAAQAQMPKDSASLAAGKKLYEYHCAFCHGRGDDGFAANLVNPHLPHAPTDSSLFNRAQTCLARIGTIERVMSTARISSSAK